MATYATKDGLLSDRDFMVSSHITPRIASAAEAKSRRSFRARQYAGTVLLGVADATILAAVYISAYLVRLVLPGVFPFYPTFLGEFEKAWWFFPIWLGILVFQGGYTKKLTAWDEVALTWKVSFMATITILAVLFITKQTANYSRTLILLMALSSLVLFPVFRILVKKVLHMAGLRRRRILILGAGEAGQLAMQALRNEPNLGYEVVGYVDDDYAGRATVTGYRVHRFMYRIHRYLNLCDIHDVLVAKPELERERLVDIINSIQHKAFNTLYVPELTGVAVLGTKLCHFFNEQAIVLEIKNNLSDPWRYLLKRTFDYFAALNIMLILAVPLLIIAVLIKFTSRGPVIFSHKRVGKDGRPFFCHKFRTMRTDAEQRLSDILSSDPAALSEWEKHRKLRQDPRITGIGRFLRRTSLDELPQLFNVIKGEMSLVGPRPVTKAEIIDHYKESASLCFSVPPGITGLWQVSGRSNSTYERRISLDCWYVRNWNLWLDIVILLKTFKVVFEKEGAQ